MIRRSWKAVLSFFVSSLLISHMADAEATRSQRPCTPVVFGRTVPALYRPAGRETIILNPPASKRWIRVATGSAIASVSVEDAIRYLESSLRCHHPLASQERGLLKWLRSTA